MSTQPRALLLLLALTACAGAETPEPSPLHQLPAPEADPMAGALARLRADSRGHTELQVDAGRLRAATGRWPVAGSTDDERALTFLRERADAFRAEQHGQRLHVQRTVPLTGFTGVQIGQSWRGLPVLGAGVTVLVLGEEVRGVLGSLADTAPASDTPGIDAVDAVALAQGRDRTATPEARPRLVVDASATSGEAPSLAWAVTLGGADPRVVLVDAHTGAVRRYAGREHSGAWSEWELDLRDANGTTAANTNCYQNPFPGDDDAGDKSGPTSSYVGDPEIEAMHDNAWLAHTWWWDLGRDSYDDQGMSQLLYGYSGVNNASWSPGCARMQFRMGWVTRDVTLHESAHAVIQYTSNLVYQDASGALNESFADVFASLEDGNWLMGEDLNNGAIRDLETPTDFGQPDHLSNFVFTNADNGGVHTNSGIPNKAWFLTADGGVHNGLAVSGIGADRTTTLAYAVMRLLPSTADIPTAALFSWHFATLYAYADAEGFEGWEACEVAAAWASVGAMSPDTDCDGALDSHDSDDDGDAVLDLTDNCALVANPQQSDKDLDGLGDLCDLDNDNDGIPDALDPCPLTPSPASEDADYDGIPDGCEDQDHDKIDDDVDNCPTDPNTHQKDSDGDGEGDACEHDSDGDGVNDDDDGCPFTADPEQLDSDRDRIGDACDRCPDTHETGTAWTAGIPGLGIPPKPLQPDSDGDGLPDLCDRTPWGDVQVAVDGAPMGLLPADQRDHGVQVELPANGRTWIPLDLPRPLDGVGPVSLDLTGVPAGLGLGVRSEDGTLLTMAQPLRGAAELRFTPLPDQSTSLELIAVGDPTGLLELRATLSQR
jgi:Zn-dependent metalloprotease